MEWIVVYQFEVAVVYQVGLSSWSIMLFLLLLALSSTEVALVCRVRSDGAPPLARPLARPLLYGTVV